MSRAHSTSPPPVLEMLVTRTFTAFVFDLTRDPRPLAKYVGRSDVDKVPGQSTITSAWDMERRQRLPGSGKSDKLVRYAPLRSGGKWPREASSTSVILAANANRSDSSRSGQLSVSTSDAKTVPSRLME